MMPAVQSLRRDLVRLKPTKWKVVVRDVATGRTIPVLVPEAASAHEALGSGLRRIARFCPGRAFKPVCLYRTL